MNSDSIQSKKSNNITYIKDIKDRNLKKEAQKLLDIRASYAIIEKCDFYLRMNSLPELADLKKEISKSLNKLRKMKNNG